MTHWHSAWDIIYNHIQVKYLDQLARFFAHLMSRKFSKDISTNSRYFSLFPLNFHVDFHILGQTRLNITNNINKQNEYSIIQYLVRQLLTTKYICQYAHINLPLPNTLQKRNIPVVETLVWVTESSHRTSRLFPERFHCPSSPLLPFSGASPPSWHTLGSCGSLEWHKKVRTGRQYWQ